MDYKKNGVMSVLKVKKASVSTLNSLKQSLPILLGVLLLLALLDKVVPKELYSKIFTGKLICDPLIGALVGSFAAGSPITSYIVGGELVKQGISLLAVAAFLISWVSVGIVQLPAEVLMLGRRFAITRNIISFATAIVIALLTIFTLRFV